MDGLQRGVDRDATQALLFHTKLPPPEKDLFRVVLAGAVWTEDRACRAKMVQTPVCQFCGKEAKKHSMSEHA